MTQEPFHIIIVEDNPFDAEIIVDAFRHHNPLLRAKVLKDGSEALEYIPAVYSDRTSDLLRLVLLDLKLPKVHGLEVLRELRADERTKNLPIVIFTSSMEEHDRTEGRRLGANDYVVKPLSFTEFIDTIGAICRTWIDMG